MIAEVKKLVLHYDASIELPFAVLAMCALLEFAVFPMVLLLVNHEIIDVLVTALE